MKKIFTKIATFGTAIMLGITGVTGMIAVSPVMTVQAAAKDQSAQEMDFDGTVKTYYGGEAGGYLEVVENIAASYGTPMANIYIAAALNGDYTAFYAAMGSKTPTYSYTNIMTNDYNYLMSTGPVCRAQMIEDKVQFIGKHTGVYSYAALKLCMTKAGYTMSNDNINAYVGGIIRGKISAPTAADVKSLTAATDTSKVNALKTSKYNSKTFNAYTYYSNYADLQQSIGPNAKALYSHWTKYGKKEGRKAI